MSLDDYELIEPTLGEEQLLKNERGHALLITGRIDTGKPILTVELYVKWYTLYLVKKEFNKGSRWEWLKVYKVYYHQLDNYRPMDQPTYVDHVPNPLAVRNFADAMGFTLDELAEELIEGRWHIEVVDQDIPCPLCGGTGTQMRPSFSDPLKDVPRRCTHCKGHRTVKRGA